MNVSDYRANIIQRERRKRLIRRWWYNIQDDLGRFLWIVVGLIVTTLFWLGLDGIERIGRHVH